MSPFEQGFKDELEKLSYSLREALKLQFLAKKHQAKGVKAFLQGLAEGPHTVPIDPSSMAKAKITELKKHLTPSEMREVSRELEKMEMPEHFKRHAGKIVMIPGFIQRLMMRMGGIKVPPLTRKQRQLLKAESWAHELSEREASKRLSPAFHAQYEHFNPDPILTESARMATLPRGFEPVYRMHRQLRKPEHELMLAATGGRVGYGFRPTRHARKHLARLMEEEAGKNMRKWLEQGGPQPTLPEALFQGFEEGIYR